VGYRFAISEERPLGEIGLSLDLITSLISRLLSPVGDIGVQIFFVISGFLITTLLINEEKANDQVSIGAFYVRRIFRILPAFAAFLVAVFLLRAAGLIQLANESFERSALFVCNFSVPKCSWWLAHTWSLGVEEQFYLAWPLLFVVLKTARVAALVAFLLMFIVGSLYFTPLANFEPIAIGALVAASPNVRKSVARLATNWSVGVAFGVLLLKPLLPGRLIALFPESLVVMGASIVPLLTAIVFFGTVARKGPLVPLADNQLVQKLGLISYSVYLWQQIGTAPEIWVETITGADVLYAHYTVAASLFIVPAAASYLMIERPFIRMGKVLSDRLILAKNTKLQVVELVLPQERRRIRM
jgi:peptidoglycan/LPS O-acetylase OafA/YrhL